jgi:hypothetical protein
MVFLAVLIYRINLILVLSLNYLHWRNAIINHRLVDSDLDPTFIIFVGKEASNWIYYNYDLNFSIICI